MVVTEENRNNIPLRLHAKGRVTSSGAENRQRLTLWTLNRFLTTVLPEKNEGPLATLFGDLPTMPLALQEEAKGRIMHLFDLIRKAHFETNPEEREALHEAVNKKLARYNATPLLVQNRHDNLPTLWMKPAQTLLSFTMPSPREIGAAWDLVFLALDGMLFELQMCPCGNLFKPSRKGQKNCSTACSKRQYSKTDKFREQRRIYMRDTYRPKNDLRAVEL